MRIIGKSLPAADGLPVLVELIAVEGTAHLT
jgi:hypothetical protein